MPAGTRFAYLIEFDDVSSIEAVSPNCIGIGAKSGNLYVKYPSGFEHIIYGAGNVFTNGKIIKYLSGTYAESVIIENSSNIGINCMPLAKFDVNAGIDFFPNAFNLYGQSHSTGNVFGRISNLNKYGGSLFALGETSDDTATPFWIARFNSSHATKASQIEIWNSQNAAMVFGTNNTEVLRLTPDNVVSVPNGYIAIGASACDAVTTLYSVMTASTGSQVVLDRVGDFTGGPAVVGRRARGTPASKTVPNDNDIAGGFVAQVWESNNWRQCATARAYVDGTVSAGSSPGKLVFQTTPSGSTTPVDRMVIRHDGSIGIGISTIETNQKLHIYEAANQTSIMFDNASTGTSNRTLSQLRLRHAPSNIQSLIALRFWDNQYDYAQSVFDGTSWLEIFKYYFTSGLLDIGKSFSTIALGSLGGKVGIGTVAPEAQIHGVSTSGVAAYFDRISNANSGAATAYRKARGTIASPDYINNNDISGGIQGWAWANSGSNNGYNVMASIRFISDGGSSFGSSPGKIVFQTTPSGSTSNVDRMVILSNGNIGFGISNPTSLLHMHQSADDAADFYISSARTSVGRIASFNLLNSVTNNYFRFVWRSYTQSSITSDEVIQTIYDSENDAWRQIIRFRLKNRNLYIGESSQLTYFAAPLHGFGTDAPSEMVHVNGNVRATGFMAGADPGIDISTRCTLSEVIVKSGLITAATPVTPVADGEYDVSRKCIITVSGGIITGIYENN